MSGTLSVPAMSMEKEQVLKLWRVEETDSEFALYDFDQIADATDRQLLRPPQARPGRLRARLQGQFSLVSSQIFTHIIQINPSHY